MPNYGANGKGGTYDGTQTHDASLDVKVDALLDFFGLSSGDKGEPANLRFVASRYWYQNTHLPPYASTAEGTEKFLTAIRTYVSTLGASPEGYTEYLNSFFDYLGSIHNILDGSWVPTSPGGGGGTSYGGLESTVQQIEGGVTYIQENPPPGYTGVTTADLDAIQQSVWGYYVHMAQANNSGSTIAIAGLITYVYSVLENMISLNGLTFPWLPDFAFHPSNPYIRWENEGYTWSWADDRANYPAAIEDDLWLPDDTYLSYLQREQPAWGWTTTNYLGIDNPNGFAWTSAGDSFGVQWWIRTVGRATGPRVGSAGSSSVGAITDSRYPGADAVTFGDPIAVTASGTFDAVCDGAKITINALPPGQGAQRGGLVNRYPYIGWLSFVGEDSEVDELQRIEFDNSVRMPHSIVRAAHITVYAKPGLDLTLTPFVIGV